jgi:hypothetical protein
MKTTLYCSGLSYQTRPNVETKAEDFQLPRLALARLNQAFLPDYSLLLLVDEVVMDERTYNDLVRGVIPVNGSSVLVLKSLYDAGMVKLVNCDRIFAKHRAAVGDALNQGLGAFKDWEAAVAQSVANWRAYDTAMQANLRPRIQRLRQMPDRRGLDYSDLASNYLHDLGGRIQIAKFFAEDALPQNNPDVEVLPDTELLINHLVEHLRNALYTLALTRELKAGVHDWVDEAPYYQKLHGSHGIAPLFELPLPEFCLWHADKVVKALSGKPAADLRASVRACLFEGVKWNEKIAGKSLAAITKIDQGLPTLRRVSAFRQERAAAVAKPAGAKKAAAQSDWWFVSEAVGTRPLAV